MQSPGPFLVDPEVIMTSYLHKEDDCVEQNTIGQFHLQLCPLSPPRDIQGLEVWLSYQIWSESNNKEIVL